MIFRSRSRLASTVECHRQTGFVFLDFKLYNPSSIISQTRFTTGQASPSLSALDFKLYDVPIFDHVILSFRSN